MAIEIGFKRKPDGSLASFTDFSILNRRVETAEEAFTLARLFGTADELLECVRHAEAQARIQAATLRSEAEVRDSAANLAHAAEKERWADVFRAVIIKAGGK